ncbi:unnamed protein product [Sphagnum jensenii]|uniref:Uncharacterized protein n=1 Tax=Sphagnum jensenii TaxID=128206 RepID=A0ABP1AVE8_9BRYO
MRRRRCSIRRSSIACDDDDDGGVLSSSRFRVSFFLEAAEIGDADGQSFFFCSRRLSMDRQGRRRRREQFRVLRVRIRKQCLQRAERQPLRSSDRERKNR